MPGDAQAKNPRGKTIYFTEADHRYIDDEGIEYTSVTTLLDEFFPKFDAETNASRIAARDNVSKEDILAKWNDKKVKAADYGTRVHENAESLVLGRLLHQPNNDKEAYAFAAVKEFVSSLTYANADIRTEQIVFSERLRIAGSIDLLCYIQETDQIYLSDYKTNEKITYEGFRGEMALAPIQHIPASKYHKYALQLNMYEFLLKLEDWVPNVSIQKDLIFIPPFSNYQIINLPDMIEIPNMLIHWLTKDYNVPF